MPEEFDFDSAFDEIILGFGIEYEILREEIRSSFLSSKAFLTGLKEVISQGLDSIDYYVQKFVSYEPSENGFSIYWHRYAHARMAGDIAMQITDEEEFKIAAFLHDLGKMVLPDEKKTYQRQNQMLNYRIRHVITGEIAAKYLGLNGFIYDAIKYHHDVNPRTKFDKNPPLHNHEPPTGLLEKMLPITYADSFASHVEPWKELRMVAEDTNGERKNVYECNLFLKPFFNISLDLPTAKILFNRISSIKKLANDWDQLKIYLFKPYPY